MKIQDLDAEMWKPVSDIIDEFSAVIGLVAPGKEQ